MTRKRVFTSVIMFFAYLVLSLDWYDGSRTLKPTSQQSQPTNRQSNHPTIQPPHQATILTIQPSNYHLIGFCEEQSAMFCDFLIKVIVGK